MHSRQSGSHRRSLETDKEPGFRFRHINLLLVWIVTVVVAAICAWYDLHGRPSNADLIALPFLNILAWPQIFIVLLQKTQVLAIGVVVLPMLMLMLSLIVLHLRKRAWTKRSRGSYTSWWQ